MDYLFTLIFLKSIDLRIYVCYYIYKFKNNNERRQYMEERKVTISNLFEGHEIRSIWDSEKEDYYFSVVDIISALTDSIEPRKYWSVLKTRLKKEGSQVTTNCS